MGVSLPKLSEDQSIRKNGSSPDASKALQAPSGDNMLSLWNCRDSQGLRVRLEPHTKAASHSPALIETTASWNASMELEQAVSIAKLGPENREC